MAIALGPCTAVCSRGSGGLLGLVWLMGRVLRQNPADGNRGGAEVCSWQRKPQHEL